MKTCWRLLLVASVLALIATGALLDFDRASMAGAERCVAAEPPPATTVTVPAAKPKDSEGGKSVRRKSVRRAIAWLVKATESKVWDEVDTDVSNGFALREVATLVTVWLLEANPDFAEFGPKVRRRCLDRAERILAGKVDHEEFKKRREPFYINWLQGFAALYAYERSLRDSKPHPALERITRDFIERQNTERGWQHGKGNALKNAIGSSAVYPNTLIATTNLALFAFGAAERIKSPVVNEAKYKKALRDGLALLHEVQGDDGSMPYGASKEKATKNEEATGRTAGMLLALAALRQTDDDLFQRAAKYVAGHIQEIPKGHAGPPLHVALGALACYALSDQVWQQYEVDVLTRVLKSQRKDGSFGEKFGEVPDAPEMSPEDAGRELFETAYNTAFYALGLSADRTALARQLRLRMPFQPAAGKGQK